MFGFRKAIKRYVEDRVREMVEEELNANRDTHQLKKDMDGLVSIKNELENSVKQMNRSVQNSRRIVRLDSNLKPEYHTIQWTLCSQDLCEQPHHRNGFCVTHFNEWICTSY